MTTKETDSRELSLGDNFGPAVISVNGVTVSVDNNGDVSLQNGDVTVDIANGNTSVFGGNVVAHTDGTIQLKPPVAEQINNPDTIETNLTDAAFRPENAMISIGLVQLNKLSPYLVELPDKAMAELLVSPKDTAVILGRDLGTWLDDVKGIRSINESRGLHFDGQILTGMQVYDECEGPREYPLEKEIADQLSNTWEEVRSSKQSVITGLFMGTVEIVRGRRDATYPIKSLNNLYSCRKIIAEQGGKFATEDSPSHSHLQSTSTQHSQYPSVYPISFAGIPLGWTNKDVGTFSSRPVALKFAGPNP